jgi:hypothetical protein
MTRKTLTVLAALALVAMLWSHLGAFSAQGESRARDAVKAATRAEQSAQAASAAARLAGGQPAP